VETKGLEFLLIPEVISKKKEILIKPLFYDPFFFAKFLIALSIPMEIVGLSP
jgi:hypothetical protein